MAAAQAEAAKLSRTTGRSSNRAGTVRHARRVMPPILNAVVYDRARNTLTNGTRIRRSRSGPRTDNAAESEGSARYSCHEPAPQRHILNRLAQVCQEGNRNFVSFTNWTQSALASRIGEHVASSQITIKEFQSPTHHITILAHTSSTPLPSRPASSITYVIPRLRGAVRAHGLELPRELAPQPVPPQPRP